MSAKKVASGVDDLGGLEAALVARIAAAQTLEELGAVHADALGRKGHLTEALKGLKKLSPEDKPKVGQRINEVKGRLEAALDAREAALRKDKQEALLAANRVDVTLPGRRRPWGAGHPLRQIEMEVVRSLEVLGFSVADGPHVETDWYNFEALNFPADHPARDMQDTFFCADKVILRTHTSNVQIRTMEKRKPPVRVLAFGMVFRHDEVDPSHSPVFHQVEGFWVDERATFADLKGVLHKMASDLFGADAKLRFRPSFFPFTEPSAEVDLQCFACGGSGRPSDASRSPAAGERCAVCKGTGWLEILGSGMVDPAVLQAVGYDPERVQGFAFGAGIERIAMLRWGVRDIRLFYENDLRFLGQFTPRI